jgi:hypothetical protein
VPLLDEQGRCRWPERFTSERIDAIRLRTGPAKFDSQMMLRPHSIIEGRLDPDRLRLYEDDLCYTEGNREARLTLANRRLVSASCWWDPSYGSPAEGDASVVAAVFTDDQGGYWLHRVRYLRHDPGQTDAVDEATQLCRQVAAFARDLHLPAVSLETNGLGRFLPGLLRQELRALNVACAVVERSSNRAKDLRIIDTFDAVLAASRLAAHRSVWDTPFIEEMREWRSGGRGRDDGLDAVAGCLLSEPVRLPRAATGELPARPNWRCGAAGFLAESDFGF